MHGLMRVRGFVQDDAHIFCTEDQIASEVADFCALVKESVQAECRDKMLALRYFGMTYCIKCQEAFVQKFGT